MTGLDFLSVASELVRTPKESHSRTAISRAYFALFHLARGQIFGWGFRVPHSDSAHSVIIRWLQNSNQVDAVRAAHVLDELRTARNRADYDLQIERYGSQTLAQQCIHRADVGVRALRACDLEPARTEVINSIRNYQNEPPTPPA